MSFKTFIHVVCVCSLLLSACGPVVQPTASEAMRTPALPAPIGTPVPAASQTPAPSDTPPPTATATTLARNPNERPTPIPAPTCLSAALPANPAKEAVTSLALASTGRLYAALYTAAISRTNVYHSDDNGQSWSASRIFNDYLSKLVVSPNFAQDQTLFAAASGGVYRSLNAGSSWTRITPGSWVTTTLLARHLIVSPNFAADRTVLLGSRAQPRGVYASTDGTTAWKDWLVDAVDGVHISPNYMSDGLVWVARNDELTFRRDVMVTINQGETWDFVRAGTAQPLAISPAYAQDSTIFWNDAKNGLFYSRNADRTSPVLEKAEADALKLWQQNAQTGWVVSGEAALNAVAFSPNFGQDRTAIASADHALVVTRNGGASWSPLCYWASDPQKTDGPRVTQLLLSPTFPSDQTLYAVGNLAQLLVSRDGGRSWAALPLK